MLRSNFSVAVLMAAAVLFKTSTALKVDMTELIYIVVSVGDTILDSGLQGQDTDAPTHVTDNDFLTGIRIPSSLHAEQYIVYDWSHYELEFFIGGVLLHTDETDMTSGTVKFYVDDQECLDTGGVGVNGIGGVFNCNLNGSVKFEARCVDVCAPYFAVQELKVWKRKALTATGGTIQMFDGNNTPNTLEKAFGVGSYQEYSWGAGTILQINQGSVSKAGVNYDWGETALVDQVYQWTQQDDQHDKLRISLTDALVTDSDEMGISSSSVIWYSESGAPHYVTVQPNQYAYNVVYWRASDQTETWLTRLVVVGTLCSDLTNEEEPLVSDWSTPSTWTIQGDASDFRQFAAATYSRCSGERVYDNATEMSFTFSDSNNPSISFDDWISTYTDGGGVVQILFDPDINVIVAYSEQTINVKITATGPNSIVREDQANIFVKDYVGLKCRSSVLETLSSATSTDLETTIYDEESLTFAIEAVQDSGTLELQQTPGFESSNCGEFTYTQQSLTTLVEQLSDLEYSARTDDRALVGPNLLQILVESVDYPDYIIPYVYDVEFEVLDCLVESLVTPADAKVFSPLYLIFQLPYSEDIKLPLLEPAPACGYTNDDLTYEFVSEKPEWLVLDQSTRILRAETSDEQLMGSTVTVKMRAFLTSDETVQTDIDFAFVFKGEKALTPPQPVIQDESDEDEEEPVEEEPTDPEPEGGWDGWKILLLESVNLGDDFKLPAPITTPGYVPTPPTAKLGSVSIRGTTQITFSEDVFILPDLMSQKIKVPRQLQQTFDFPFDERPFVEVKVIPGYMSDPEKLDYTYTVGFKDAKTLEVTINFKTPTYVSANQPEDILEITFWGPFYDQQDGLEITLESKTIRTTIPPQVVPGGVTDAITSAGDSMQAGSMSVLAGNALINVALAGSLNQVWGMVNNLQIIIHSPLINVQFPGNAFILYEVMIQVATFDILPTDDIFPLFFTQLPEQDAFSDKFDRLGYGSMFILMNLGTMLLVFIYYSILYMIYPCARLAKPYFDRAYKLEQSLKGMLFWNHAIVFLQEGLIEILLSGTVNMIFIARAKNAWSNWNLVFSNLTSIVLLTASVSLMFVTLFLWPKRSELKQKKYRKRVGSIYGMVDVTRNKWTMIFPVLFFVRRIAFAVAVVFLVEYPTFQLFIFLVSALVTMVVLGVVEPLKNRGENKLEIYNSFTILLLSYCLLSFTPYVLDADARYQVGFGMVILTVQNIVVNMVIVGKDPVRMVYLRCRRNYIRRRIIKNRLLRQASKTRMFFSTSYRKMKTTLGITEKFTEDSTPSKKMQYLFTIQESSNEEVDSDGNDDLMKDSRLIKSEKRTIRIQKQATEMLQQIKKHQTEVIKTQAKSKAKVDHVLSFYLFNQDRNPVGKKMAPSEHSCSSFSSSSSEQSSDSNNGDSYFSNPFDSHQGSSLQRHMQKTQSKSLQKLRKKAAMLSSHKAKRQDGRHHGISVRELPSVDSSAKESSSHMHSIVEETKLGQSSYLIASQTQHALSPVATRLNDNPWKIPTAKMTFSGRTLKQNQASNELGSPLHKEPEAVEMARKGQQSQAALKQQQSMRKLNQANSDLTGANNDEFYSYRDERRSPELGEAAAEERYDDDSGVLGLPRRRKTEKHLLGQTTMMANGIPVLFPDLYTEQNGVLKLDSHRDGRNTMQPPVETQQVKDSGRHRKKEKKTARDDNHHHQHQRNKKVMSQTQNNDSSVGGGGGTDSNLSKQELRNKVMNNFLKGFEMQEANKKVPGTITKVVNEVPLTQQPSLLISQNKRYESEDDDQSETFDSALLHDVKSLQSGDASVNTRQTTVDIAKALQKIRRILK